MVGIRHPKGGVKVDERAYTTPNVEKTDLYAHWNPNSYPLKVTYNTDVFNSITVKLKRNDGSNVRNYTLGNNGSCTILFDDIVTVTANTKGDWTEGNWIYDDGSHRHHKRHYYRFGSWSMIAANDPVQPSLVSTTAQTTSFTLTATGGVTLNVSGSHTTGNVDHQTKHEYVRIRYKNTFSGDPTDIYPIHVEGDGVTREFSVGAAHWKITASLSHVKAEGGVATGIRTITIFYQKADGSWEEIDHYTGTQGNLTIEGDIPEDAYWWS